MGTMTEPTKSLGECVRDGVNYLEQGRFDEALREFRERNPDENSLISYGIATAFFAPEAFGESRNSKKKAFLPVFPR